MKSSRLASAIVFVGIAAAAVLGYVAWTRSPSYALREAGAAFRQHDLATFQKYVDTERVTGRFIDDMFSAFTEEAKKDSNPFSGLAVGMFMMMRPQVAKLAQESFERAVESGTFDAESKDGKKDNPAKITEPYWTPADKNRSGYRGVSYVKRQGKIALAGLEIFDADLRKSFMVDLKLRDLGDHWQVAEIANVKDLQDGLQKATQDRLDQLNTPIRAQLAGIVRFDSLSASTSTGAYGFERKCVLSTSMRNISSRVIRDLRFAVKFVDPSDQEIGVMRCVGNGGDAGALVGGYWTRDVNQFDAADMKLFNGIDHARAVPEVTSVSFDDGTAIELRTSVRNPVIASASSK